MRTLGWVLFTLVGLYDLIFSLLVITYDWGVGGAVAAFLVAPVTLALAPLYAALKYGAWMQLLIIYGGGLLAMFIISAGQDKMSAT